MGQSSAHPTCPRCAAAVEVGAAVCAACGQELELTSPAAQPLIRPSAPKAPRASSPREPPTVREPTREPPTQREPAQVSTDVSPAYVPPVASPSPLLDAPPEVGSQTRNDRVALESPGSDQTHPSLEAIPAVVTKTAPAAAPLPEPTTPLGERLAPDPVLPTSAMLPPVVVNNEATHLKLSPVADSNATYLKLPEVSAPPPKPPWAMVLLGTSAMAALVLGLVLAFMPTDAPQPQVIEVPAPVEVKTEAAKTVEPSNDAPAVVSNHPAPSYGDPLERKEAFYPEHPTEVAKRGVAPSKKPPAKGVLRVISTVQGNQVAAPLSVDHMPVGMTPKELSLKPGTHVFEVLTGDGPPVTVHYPVTQEKRGKTGEILEIDITQDGDTRPGSRQLDARADRPIQTRNARGGK